MKLPRFFQSLIYCLISQTVNPVHSKSKVVADHKNDLNFEVMQNLERNIQELPMHNSNKEERLLVGGKDAVVMNHPQSPTFEVVEGVELHASDPDNWGSNGETDEYSLLARCNISVTEPWLLCWKQYK